MQGKVQEQFRVLILIFYYSCKFPNDSKLFGIFFINDDRIVIRIFGG